MKIKSDAVEKEACYQAEINDAPRLLAEIKLTLSAPVATIEVIAPENATLAQIEQFATEAEAGSKRSRRSC